MSTSRIPARSTRTPLKAPSTPTRTRLGTPTTPSRNDPANRSRSPTKQRLPPRSPEPEVEKKPPLSIKEAIALKRAEAKKAQATPNKGTFDDLGTLEDALPTTRAPVEDEDLLGRLPLRETIEKSRSTGTLNIATRSLPCLPSGLFEIHLNVTPEPLKSVPNEPPLPPAEPSAPRRGGKAPAWFEAQDLTALKAWNNEIAEIQPEISMFGSLKTVDLHKNKLVSLPKTFADLSFLAILDLSHNQLTELPENLWAMPELTTLNLAHNQLTSLPLNAPFKSTRSRTGPNSYTSTNFFTPAIVRSTTPLPKLISLDVSHNKITSSAIDLTIPESLVKFNLSDNPVGNSAQLLKKLSTLPRLKELRFEKATIENDSIPSDLFATAPFPCLSILDFSGTQITLDAVKSAFSLMKQELNHDFTDGDPPQGVVKILAGKRIIREAWELELERRRETRKAAVDLSGDWDTPEPVKRTVSPAKPVAKTFTPTRGPIASKKEPVKEAWEIEAEQGLFTEGARRRARAAAAAKEAKERAAKAVASNDVPSPSASDTSFPSTASSINNVKYYTKSTETLKLPASAPPPKGPGHNRSFSVASPAASFGPSRTPSEDLALPAPTLPLSVILAQPFADTLRVLILSNRRLERSFMIPSLPAENSTSSGFLPRLEELDLEGCNFNDVVTVQFVPVETDSGNGTGTPPRSSEPLLPTLTRLFPSLRTLTLSYNRISDTSLTFENLSSLLLQSPTRAGLRQLRLRGNKINDLAGFQKVAEMFKGNRDVPEWKLEELDLRDNEISRLPPELGLMPLDVFLVEGNTFRIPQRRIWEREGTKGLLSWLRGRIE